MTALPLVSMLLQMSMFFHAIALSDDLVPQALPLIQATWPDVDLSAWQSFVRFFSDRELAAGSGVVALHDPTGGLCGVFAYRLDRDLRNGPVLAVQLFTAVDVVNSLRTVRALLEAAKARAFELGCTCLEIRLCSRQAELASRLHRLGLSREAGLSWSKIDRPQRGG
jgi:hypothetical protein